MSEAKEKWEEESQEKETELLGVRHHLEEQRREREEEVKALLEKQLLAVEEETERLKTSHQQEIKDLMERHRQEVGFTNFIHLKGHTFYRLMMMGCFLN